MLLVMVPIKTALFSIDSNMYLSPVLVCCFSIIFLSLDQTPKHGVIYLPIRIVKRRNLILIPLLLLTLLEIPLAIFYTTRNTKSY